MKSKKVWYMGWNRKRYDKWDESKKVWWMGWNRKRYDKWDEIEKGMINGMKSKTI